MKRVFITGVDGFTGQYLATDMREAGFQVFGSSMTRSVRESGVYQCELCDLKLMRAVLDEVRPDYVVHLAGVAFVGHADVDAMYRTNIVGSRNLLDAVSKCGYAPKMVLLASSSNIYGNATSSPIDETTPAAPANDYAVSKLAMENMARLWLDRLPIAFVRPFNYTGVGQSTQFLLPKIVDHFKRRAPLIELGNLNVVRDFSDVRTVATCYRLLMERAQHGEAYNICSGVGQPLTEIVRMASELSNHRLEVVSNPAFMRGNEVHALVGSAGKLARTIGSMVPRPIFETLQWMMTSK